MALTKYGFSLDTRLPYADFRRPVTAQPVALLSGKSFSLHIQDALLTWYSYNCGGE